MSINTRQVIENQVQLIRQRIREAVPDLMLQLESMELALKNLAPDRDSMEYAGHRLAIDAVEAYLRKVNHTARGGVIAQAIVNGGWLAKDKRARSNVLESIRYHLKHPKKTTNRIRMFDGTATDPENAEIGLAGWDDSFRRV